MRERLGVERRMGMDQLRVALCVCVCRELFASATITTSREQCNAVLCATIMSLALLYRVECLTDS